MALPLARVLQVTRPNELGHLDMPSVWVAEHGCCYLMAAIDRCPREIVGSHLELRCRAKDSIALWRARLPRERSSLRR